MIDAVIFDLDGTLISLPIEYEVLFNKIKKIIDSQNVRPLVETIEKLDCNLKEQVFDVWDRAELKACNDVLLKKEGINLYNKYFNKPKALVTMQGKKAVAKILENLELKFDVIVTREKSLNRMEQIKFAMHQLKTTYQNILFIADSLNDEKVAKNLGCKFIKIC